MSKSATAKYVYSDGSEYHGEWSEQGQRNGFGQMKFPDGSSYTGHFEVGLCEGLGVMVLGDQSV